MRTQLPNTLKLGAPLFALLVTTFGFACSGTPDQDITIDTYAISTSLQPSRAPALTFDGTSMLAVWPEDVAGKTELFARAFSQTGVALTPKSRITPNNGFSKGNVDVAFGNGSFLVVFEQAESGKTTVKGIRLQLGGGAVLIKKSLFAIDSDARFPRVAFASQRGKFFMVTLGLKQAHPGKESCTKA
jgi:hypothetical protein